MIIGSAYKKELRGGLGKDDSLFIILYNSTFSKRHELRVSASVT